MDERKKVVNFLKGCLAECLVERLLSLSGNSIHRFGHEYRSGDPKNHKSRIAPDFEVKNLQGKLNYLEVKYRKGGLLPRDDARIENIKRFWPNTYLVLVHSIGLDCPFQVYGPASLPADEFRESVCPIDETSELWQIKPSILVICGEQVDLFRHLK